LAAKQRFIRTQYGTSKEEVEDFFIDLSSAPVDLKPDANGWMPGPTFGRWSAKEGRFIKDTELSAKKTMITPDERSKQRNRAKRERKRQSR